MKKSIIFTVLIILIALSQVPAAEIPSYQDKYVNDFAKLLSENESGYIRSLLVQLESDTTAEVSVVTVPDCGGDYKGFAVELASTWKIGKADKDNGLLILYCVNVKKLDIETGYGLEGILPDSKIGRYLDDYYVPLRNENKTAAGIISFTEQMVNIIEENKAEVISGQAGRNSGSGNNLSVYVVFAIIILLVIIIIAKIKSKKNAKKIKAGKKPNAFAKLVEILSWIVLVIMLAIGFNILLLLLFIALIILRAILGGGTSASHPGFLGGGFGGGSSGFGGGGFGGGGFGGGGASR